MQKKRDRHEIIYNILKIISEHKNYIRKTPLLRYSNLSTQSFTEYYQELISKELIKLENDKKGNTYISLTEKGFKFLEKYRFFLDFINEFEL